MLPHGLLRATQAVGALTKRIQPRYVHAHSSWAGVYARIFPVSAPVIYEPHCYKFDDMDQSRSARYAFKQAERLLARRAAVTVALSPHEEQLARHLHGRARVELLPNTAAFKPTDAHGATGFKLGNQAIMIGRLSRQKDPAFFAQVADTVRATLPEIRFKWIGDGDSSARRGLEDVGVEVTGWVDQDRMREELAASALYVHTARYEGFPLSVLDAAAFEHPIVARRIPAFEGLGIPMAETPEGVARLIVEAASGGHALSAATAAASALNASMTPSAQRRALHAIYEHPIGV